MSTPEVINIKGHMVYEVPEIHGCEGCKFDVSPSRCGISSVGAKRSCQGNYTIYIDATPQALAEYALNKE